MKIEIEFDPRFYNSMVAETKTSTTRYSRHGNHSDFFEFLGHLYCIDEIKRVYLYKVAQNCFRSEGFTSEQEFIDYWTETHPRLGYRPNDMVFFHRFYRET